MTAFFNRYVMDYLDSIFVQSDTLDENRICLRMVMEALLLAELHLKLEKCEFIKKRYSICD